eukprot:403360847
MENPQSTQINNNSQSAQNQIHQNVSIDSQSNANQIVDESNLVQLQQVVHDPIANDIGGELLQGQQEDRENHFVDHQPQQQLPLPQSSQEHQRNQSENANNSVEQLPQNQLHRPAIVNVQVFPNRLDSRFLVKFYCDCCPNLDAWFSRDHMINNFGFLEHELKSIEEKAIKDKKEQDTKEAADELQKFLDFDDIKDFNNLPEGTFEEINFSCSTQHQNCDEEDSLESQTEDNDESYCPERSDRNSSNSVQSRLRRRVNQAFFHEGMIPTISSILMRANNQDDSQHLSSNFDSKLKQLSLEDFSLFNQIPLRMKDKSQSHSSAHQNLAEIPLTNVCSSSQLLTSELNCKMILDDEEEEKQQSLRKLKQIQSESDQVYWSGSQQKDIHNPEISNSLINNLHQIESKQLQPNLVFSIEQTSQVHGQTIGKRKSQRRAQQQSYLSQSQASQGLMNNREYHPGAKTQKKREEKIALKRQQLDKSHYVFDGIEEIIERSNAGDLYSSSQPLTVKEDKQKKSQIAMMQSSQQRKQPFCQQKLVFKIEKQIRSISISEDNSSSSSDKLQLQSESQSNSYENQLQQLSAAGITTSQPLPHTESSFKIPEQQIIKTRKQLSKQSQALSGHQQQQDQSAVFDVKRVKLSEQNQ